MSEDPISKSQIGAGLGRRDVIPKNKGRGQIYTDKDYYGNFRSLSSRVIFALCCVVPYIAIAIHLYFTADKVIAIIMLAIPLVIGLAFWFVTKRMKL